MTLTLSQLDEMLDGIDLSGDDEYTDIYTVAKQLADVMRENERLKNNAFIINNESRAIVTISPPEKEAVKDVNGVLVMEPAGPFVITIRDAEEQGG